MELIIEEISRGHKLLGRHKTIKNTVTIGRGYNNDIILTDPHVCPEHLSLDYDGENWIVSDKDTINGSFLETGKNSADQHVISSGDIISIGKSQIRIIFPHHPVAKSVTFSPFESLISSTRHPAIIIGSMFLFTFVAGFIFYLNNSTKVTFTQLLVPSVGMTLLFALWPSMVALISHLTKHDARIMNQLGISFVFFNLMWITDVFETIAQFNLSSNWPLTGLITLFPIGLGFCLFWLNCYIGFHMTKERRLTVALSLTAILFGGSFLIKLSHKPDFNPLPSYNVTIMTPNFLIAPSNTTDNFLKDSAQLFDKTRKAAQKK